MTDQIIILLTTSIVILTVLSSLLLLAMILFFMALRRTLLRLREAIDNVEDTALRSLAPLLSFRALFTDTDGFLTAIRALMRRFRGSSRKVR